MRARFYDTAANSWSGAQTFTVQHVPSASTISPVGGTSIQYATSVPLNWLFSDVYSGDGQTAYQVELWKSSDKAGSLIDTTKVSSSSTSVSVGTVDATWKDIPLSWRVKVWDIDDVASEWSPTASFYLRDLPVVSVTYPTNGGTVTVPSPTFTWTFSSNGGAQTNWRVIVTDEDTSTVAAESGPRTGTNLSWTPADAVIDLSVNYSVKVDSTDASGLTGTDTNTFTALYTAPTAPSLIISTTNFAESSYVYLDWSSSTVDVDNSGWRVYRRTFGEVNWALAYDGGEVPAVRSLYDYLAPSNQLIEYGVVQVNSSFDGLIESTKTTGQADLTGLGGEYMLLVPDEPSLNMVLFYVKSDTFNEEYEQQALNLVERGRRQEIGTRAGQSGSLSAELRQSGGR